MARQIAPASEGAGVAHVRHEMVTSLRASCTCTAPLMVDRGRVVCATCSAPVIALARDFEPDTYTSIGPLPPGRSRRWFREHAPEIPGAIRTGGARGRSVVWSVSRSDYDRWATTPMPEAGASSVVDVDSWLAAANYRATRSA